MALFEPFRAIGHIADDVPFAVQRRGRETYATVSVGNAWQVRLSWLLEVMASQGTLDNALGRAPPQGMPPCRPHPSTTAP